MLQMGHQQQPICSTDSSKQRTAGIPSEVEGLKDLQQGEVLAISEDDHLPGLLAQLALDEAQQVLLVHARAVVHMRIHLYACKSQSKASPPAGTGEGRQAL